MRFRVAASAGKRITSPTRGARRGQEMPGRRPMSGQFCGATRPIHAYAWGHRETLFRQAMADRAGVPAACCRDRRQAAPAVDGTGHSDGVHAAGFDATDPLFGIPVGARSRGAQPAALSASGTFAPGLAIRAKQSPPMPVIGHSTTANTAAAAIAASTALPPWRRISMAVRLAAGWKVAHIARRP